MHSVVIIDFFMDLPSPPKCELGFEKLEFDHGSLKENIAREVQKLDIMQDEEGFVYFHDVLYKAFKRVYRNFTFEKDNYFHKIL